MALTLLLALVFTGCETKSTQKETNTSNVQNSTVESTGDISVDANASTGGNDANIPATLKSLALNIEKTTLNKDENTIVKVMATHSDNSTKEVTNIVEWITTSSDSIKVKKTTLTALKDKNTSIKAKLNNTLSNEMALNITWVVNGHALPPEPDPTVNDSTLLGVDVNDNGVRDDVERWIYETYKYPIERGIFMQSARVYNLVIIDPSKAHETVKHSDNVLACQFYWIYESNLRPFDKYKHFGNRKKFKQIQFNTIKRDMAYERYNAEFSGEVLSSPNASKDKCEFD